MITIYHNPRCRKSREGLVILEALKIPFEIRKYLDETLSYSELKTIIEILKIEPIDLIRKNEAIWKSDFKNKDLTNNEIISAMVEFPKLIERPIVIKDKEGILGRPPEKIKSLFK